MSGHDRHGRPPRPHARRSFTLIEILVVIAILALLISLVYKGGGALIGSAKSRDTEGLLKTLQTAIEAYKLDTDDKRIPNATPTFNGYPPDNPYVLTEAGGNPADGNAAGGCDLRMVRDGAMVHWSGQSLGLTELLDVRDGNGQIHSSGDLRHGDIRAFVLAIRLRSPKAQEILDRVDKRFWVSGRDDDMFYDPGHGGELIPLDYLKDAWGNPLQYFSTCICGPDPSMRDEASNDFLHRNNDGPFLVSYGPNGSDQLATDFLQSADSTLVGDYWNNYTDTSRDGTINHELNGDNIYSTDAIAKRLRVQN